MALWVWCVIAGAVFLIVALPLVACSSSTSRGTDDPLDVSYGLGIYPLREVKSRLPHPPVGHFWELGTEVVGEYRMLRLNLVSIATSSTVKSSRTNLDWNREMGLTWSECRQRWGMLATKDERSGIVAPLVSWAVKVKRSMEQGVGLENRVVIA